MNEILNLWFSVLDKKLEKSLIEQSQTEHIRYLVKAGVASILIDIKYSKCNYSITESLKNNDIFPLTKNIFDRDKFILYHNDNNIPLEKKQFISDYLIKYKEEEHNEKDMIYVFTFLNIREFFKDSFIELVSKTITYGETYLINQDVNTQNITTQDKEHKKRL